MSPTTEDLVWSGMKEGVIRYVRPLVADVLENWSSRKWSLQGFGMLRTYISKELRLHVWDSRFAVPRVTTVHDHPWDFDSWVISGRIVNTRFRVHPFELPPSRGRMTAPLTAFIKTQIVCGPNSGNSPSKLKVGGERVWLEPLGAEEYLAGDHYHQSADEVHHSSYADGTVTLVHRRFLPDTEHAHVFFRADEEWVSAEPRDATPDEVSQIVDRAVEMFA